MKITDFHSHILPCADHGSDGITTSISQIDKMEIAGVAAVVATPHFYPYSENVDVFLRRRDAAEKLLLENLPCRAPKIYIGAEVLICPNLHKMEGLDKLCIRGTDTLLIEMPTSGWTEEILDTLHEISLRYHVVLAHIDRYRKSLASMVTSCGYDVQLNASTFSSLMSRRRADRYIKEGVVAAIGSDLHGEESYEQFLRAVERKPEYTAVIMEKTQELLNGAVSIN